MNTHKHTPSEIAALGAIFPSIKAGDEITLSRDGKSIEKIEIVQEAKTEENSCQDRKLGWLKGKVWMANDFDEWPEEEARALGIID